uniref:Uncharacterized protein n=1 Tax=Rhizophora mucronata TaxID=61149 RepID=A0A2P2Q998_RHIMU
MKNAILCHIYLSRWDIICPMMAYFGLVWTVAPVDGAYCLSCDGRNAASL